jgi:glycosyltransferase involved in cell wall biosynthesis
MFMTSIFPNPVEPTLGTFHGHLSYELAQICDLTVVTPHPWFPRSPRLPWLERWQRFSRIPRQFTMKGVTAFSPKYLMVPGVSEDVRPMLMYPGLSRVAKRAHVEDRVDVINALWMYPDGVAAAHVARRLGVPLVLTGLGCDINLCLDDAWKRRQILDATSHARAIIVVSTALKERLCSEGVPENKISVIVNGVDTGLFSCRDRKASARQLGLSDGDRRCVFVGRLAEEKGVHTLVAAMSHLRRLRTDTKVYVVGDGPKRAELEQQAKDLGVAEQVVFLGTKGPNEVALWLAASDLLCLPSLREGCPNVVLEALAAGRPVVASRVGGIPDMVEPDSGVLVQPENPDALADALNFVLSAPWDAERIRRSVADRSWRRTAMAYREVYLAACS